ncbi:MAG: hypothetical protein NTW58_03695 [Actinobacteria bacterium]|nr:hypothetical protein [Actinomycetota bacterium]
MDVAPSTTWRARPASGAASPLEEQVIPRVRHHKATRCRHCDYCRPHGGAGGLRLCEAPGRADGLVVGDQMACGQYQPWVQ